MRVQKETRRGVYSTASDVRMFTSLHPVIAGRTVDYELAGAKPSDTSLATAWHNGGLLNATLRNLTSGDVLVIPNKTFTLLGGIEADGLKHVIIQVDGTLDFLDNLKAAPHNHPLPRQR